MKRSILAGSVAACVGLATPLLAAEPPATGPVIHPAASKKTLAAVKPAEKCLNDLRAFDTQMGKDGYWLGGAGYGFGYPMDGYGYGYPMGGYPAVATAGYQDARPGYEVRMLVAAANILARQGQQQQCENVLATTRTIYAGYVADMHSEGVPMADMPHWRQNQIAAAEPVTSKTTSFRSDELLDTDVRDPQNEALGSVDDLVLSPKTGDIAYLVISRGGIFGIDKKYTPVPWADFKIAPNVNLLVLDATKGTIDAAPQVSSDKFATPGQFDQESQKVDAYWKGHLATVGEN
jgi:sporulation protein YlmC with PRC-barrel domain